jgi:hypothetical protein
MLIKDVIKVLEVLYKEHGTILVMVLDSDGDWNTHLDFEVFDGAVHITGQ